jgi:hypothetical protein
MHGESLSFIYIRIKSTMALIEDLDRLLFKVNENVIYDAEGHRLFHLKHKHVQDSVDSYAILGGTYRLSHQGFV